MKVELHFPDETDYPLLTLDLDVIPRQGERIELSTWDIPPLFVQSVRHTLVMHGKQMIEQLIIIQTTFMPETAHNIQVVWEADRPHWIPEQLFIDCDYIPRSGDVIDIGLVDKALLAQLYEEGGAIDVPTAHRVTVEVITVAHASFIQQTEGDRDAGLGFGDLQSEMIVRNASHRSTSDIQRMIARARKN